MKNLVFLICIIFLVGCAEMNDKHDEFLARGETVYIGKVDSATVFPGDGRLLLKYWLSDPRAKNVTVYWGFNDGISKVLSVAQHSSEEALEATFDATDGLTEGNYTFHLVSSDLHDNKSMKFELPANIYGSRYKEQLLNRRIVETIPAVNGEDVDIILAGASSGEEIGIELFYTKMDGTEVTDYYPQAGTSISLLAVDYTQGVRYRTWYKPTPTAIDSFCTNIAGIGIVKLTNVALGKPVTATHTNSAAAAAQPANAVDGDRDDFVNNRRWVSTTGGFPQTMEIDLQGEYTISRFKMWNGAGGANGYGYPIGRFELQALIAGTWETVHSVTGNADPTYGGDFAPVAATKVRFVVYNEVRLFELEVYNVVTY
ncbi:hypothetical protein SAMD00024442_4_38 [Candidatus Symbiothrix dinenymphae]|nr:hypothetical protein SAMD00024442_4_38 [Candidatus Symbiothrix dinenymphae]